MTLTDLKQIIINAGFARTYCGNTDEKPKRPYVIIDPDALSCLHANDRVIMQRQRVIITLYTGRIDREKQKAMEKALDANNIGFSADHYYDEDEKSWAAEYEVVITDYAD